MLTPKENLLRTIRFQDAERVPFGLESAKFFFHRDSTFFWSGSDPAAREWTDAWGVRYKYADAQACHAYPVSHPLESWEQFENFPFPDPSDPALFAEAARQIKEVDRKNHLIHFNNAAFIFVRTWLLRGMENALTDMLENPALYEALLEKIFTYQETIVKNTMAFKPDIMQFGDDAGTTTALMMNPALWRKWIKPRLKKNFDICKNAGCIVVFHCCGRIEEILDDIIEIGVDVLNPLQAGANDLVAVKKKASGKLALYGGIDAHTVATAAPQTVAELTRQVLGILGEGGGYIAFPDQSLPFPPENVEAMKRVILYE